MGLSRTHLLFLALVNVPEAGQIGGRVVSGSGLEQLREQAAQTLAPVAPALTSVGGHGGVGGGERAALM